MNTSELVSIKQQFGIIGNDAELMRAIDIAVQVAHTDLTVLITGESGVGKEHFPKIIHANSARKHGKYFAVNCGAIPEGTIDSELFGHVKGAFTDAVSERSGYFGEADGGTIFLDEVGELPLSTQARLLRVLENGEYMRVGSSKVEKTNVRIVCATNVNLPEAIAEGRFREDLYYRLSTVPIKIPALRERGSDVLLLFKKFAMDFSAKYNIPKLQLTEAAEQVLTGYSWPGNVRQLKNITEQISILELERVVSAEKLKGYLPEEQKVHLPALAGGQHQKGRGFESEREILYNVLFDMRRDITELRAQVRELTQGTHIHHSADNIQYYDVHHEYSLAPTDNPAIQIETASRDRLAEAVDGEEYVEEALSLNDMEKRVILQALERNKGRRRDAAKELNISERTLYRKIKEYGI